MALPQLGYLRELKTKLFAEVTEVPAILQDSYYPLLDGLRGIAIIMVIIYHFGANHFFRPFHFLFNGELGVNIFFVISGFLITTLLLKERLQHGKVSFKRFYARRALRIIPVAYLFLLVMIGLNSIYKLGLTSTNFLSAGLFYKNVPFQNDNYTGHFWSLAAEVQFYLIAPYILVSNVNRYCMLALSIVMLILILSLLGFYCPGFLHSNPIVYRITQACMYFFWNGPFVVLIGSLFAVFLFKGIISIEKGSNSYLLGFLLLVIILTICNKLSLLYYKYISEFIAAILTGWIIVLSLKGRSLLSGILESRILIKIGVISYSLYIWQELFIGTRTFPVWVQPFHSYPLWLFITLKLVCVFTIAFASYYLFESKFLRIKKRYE